MDIACDSDHRDKERALFRRMVLSHFDIEEAKAFLENLIELAERSEMPGHAESVTRAALLTAAIVAYWRPFAKSDDDGETALRLPRELISGLAPALLELHSRIGTLRNEQFAHSDPDATSIQVDWNLRDHGFGFPVPTSVATRVEPDIGELRKMLVLMREVSRCLHQEYTTLGARLLE